MTKTVSANDAKNRLGSLLDYVNEQNDEVIVERHGKPHAVIMSIAAYDEVQILRQQQQRADAIARLHRLHDRLAARNQDLSEEEVEEIAVRISHELIDDLAARGEITFERDRR